MTISNNQRLGSAFGGLDRHLELVIQYNYVKKKKSVNPHGGE